MPVLANVASRAYAPQIVTIPFNLTGKPALVRITLTRLNWPASLVAKVGVVWDNGNTSFAWLYGGAAGTVVQSMGVPDGVSRGSAQIEVVQNFITPVLVESF